MCRVVFLCRIKGRRMFPTNSARKKPGQIWRRGASALVWSGVLICIVQLSVALVLSTFLRLGWPWVATDVFNAKPRSRWTIYKNLMFIYIYIHDMCVLFLSMMEQLRTFCIFNKISLQSITCWWWNSCGKYVFLSLKKKPTSWFSWTNRLCAILWAISKTKRAFSLLLLSYCIPWTTAFLNDKRQYNEFWLILVWMLSSKSRLVFYKLKLIIYIYMYILCIFNYTLSN